MFLVFRGPVLSLRRGGWAGFWLGIEINLFGFLVFINVEGKSVAEPLIKYFVVQRIGSALMIRGFLLNDFFLFSRLIWTSLLGVLLKGGFFPFHRWVPSVASSCKWVSSFIVLRWQKLVPLVFFFRLSSFSFYYMTLIGMRVVGGVGGLNQHSVRSMSAYSSFVHTAWIIAAILVSAPVFFVYFLFYCISLAILFSSCGKFGKDSLKIKRNSLIRVLSLIIIRGLPPFAGFVGKVLVFLIRDFYVVIFCILGSLVRIKYYLSFMYGIILRGSQVKDFILVTKRWVRKVVVLVNIAGFIVMVLLFV